MFYVYNCYIIWKIYMYKFIKRKILMLNVYVWEYILIKGVMLLKFNFSDWYVYKLYIMFIKYDKINYNKDLCDLMIIN